LALLFSRFQANGAMDLAHYRIRAAGARSAWEAALVSVDHLLRDPHWVRAKNPEAARGEAVKRGH
jgi:hypothetical protein